jgi:hypothetical protein
MVKPLLREFEPARLPVADSGPEARARGRAAGRNYPNLVDSMAVARKAKNATSRKVKKGARKS